MLPYPEFPHTITLLEQILNFIGLYELLLFIIGMSLPCPLFLKLFKIAFPFVEKLIVESQRDE